MTNLNALAEKLVLTLKDKELKISTAESCTGGMIACALTSVSGSSDVFEYGFVTYANTAKENLLGVSNKTLEMYGAVSAETVKEMAEGALKVSNADIAIATSGIAGPTGGTPEKPVGLVWFGLSTKEDTKTFSHTFQGNREEIRTQAMAKIITTCIQKVS